MSPVLPPTVAITSPSNNASFTGPLTIPITAIASDPDGTVTKVEFYNGATLLGSDTTSPYTYAWTNAANGSYTISAKAIDNGGAIGTSAEISLSISTVIENAAPTISLTDPATGASFTSGTTISLVATAADSDGTISKVEFYSNESKIGEDTSSPFNYSWENVSAGTYTLSTKAIDNEGKITTKP